MGYDICITPGPQWFASHAYINPAFTKFKNLPAVGSARGIKTLCTLYQVRLGLARGILLMSGSVPDSGNIYTTLQRAATAAERGDPDLAGTLAALSTPHFTVSYSGTGQYGVPGYVLTRGDEMEHAATQLGPLFDTAYHERYTHATALLAVAKKMLWGIYWQERKHDLTYYGYWDVKDDEGTLETAIKEGIFPDRVAALNACGGDLHNVRSLPEIQKLGKRLNEESWHDLHDSELLSSDEEDAIWHGHSD